MKRAIEEREQSQHSAKLNQRVDSKDLSQRRDCDSKAEEDECQHSCRPRRELERVWTNSFVVEIPQEQHQRNARVYEEDEFTEACVAHNQCQRSKVPY